MLKEEAAIRIEKLRKEIDYHRYLYHVLDRQEISDAANDSLKHELKLLEDEFPEFITPDSPTQRVGGEAQKEFKKIRHSRPMLSLEDVFNEQEFDLWLARVMKFAGLAKPPEIFAELKFDGLARPSLTRAGF